MNDIKYLQAYKDFISFERRLSDHTIKNYFRDIDMLIQYNKGISLGELESNNIRNSIA